MNYADIKIADGSAGTINKVDAGKVYNIEVKRDTKSGLVNKIIIKDRT